MSEPVKPEPILVVDDLVKHFPAGEGRVVHAVDGISLELAVGETLSLVGESGCGKSTLGKTIMRLYPPTSGSVRIRGQEMANVSRRAMRPLRRDLQMVFQDPFASLNPRITVGRAIEEPLIVHGLGNGRERRERVAWLLQKVGLPADAAGRHPHEFSGGQRQRIGIARALALNPKVIICDEPVSALDVSVRAQVLNLLADLKAEFGLAYLFISHDLSVVEYVSERVAVMYLGKIVEVATRDQLWSRPLHPYTRALLDAAPIPDPLRRRARRPRLEGEIPSPLDPPSGCRFRTRCPLAIARCTQEMPHLLAAESGHQVACHRAFEDGIALPPTATPAVAPEGPALRALS
ncbi:oligopeptide/dipeptide ABC transporter ATP-binding protein [Bosea sp. (in: a-proteobacteria)]|uniref:ABC transporter ATP-binding protein n=1 Tax=Bosea sp. (in: a-proteobacteria) TaxID=1871050 RepID=UPI0025C65256|nr:oligopeptide/dipeptide ABC transporter ATP-binding protein [Bosea sp. (in: a-proteobacteria)]